MEANHIPTGGPVEAVPQAGQVVPGRLEVFGERPHRRLRVMIPWALSPTIGVCIAFALLLADAESLANAVLWIAMIGGAVSLWIWSAVVLRDWQNPWWPMHAFLLMFVMWSVNFGVVLALVFAGCAIDAASQSSSGSWW